MSFDNAKSSWFIHNCAEIFIVSILSICYLSHTIYIIIFYITNINFVRFVISHPDFKKVLEMSKQKQSIYKKNLNLVLGQ